MPCDGGSRLLVVGGFHHSGTGIITHAIKVRALGGDSTSRANQWFIDSDIKDLWPPTHGDDVHKLNCTDTWSIWKHPTNSAREVQRFLALRSIWPRLTLVYTERDAPNVVWSLMKRFRSWKAENIATHLGHYCEVWREYHKRQHSDVVHFVDLQNFSNSPRPIVERIIPVPTPLGGAEAERTQANASRGAAMNSVSVKLQHVHLYGARHSRDASAVTVLSPSDAELEVMPYDPLAFAREVESEEWQTHLHDLHLYGTHGPVNLLNVTAALMSLQCGRPILNVSAR